MMGNYRERYCDTLCVSMTLEDAIVRKTHPELNLQDDPILQHREHSTYFTNYHLFYSIYCIEF
jgi:hypothetical protein